MQPPSEVCRQLYRLHPRLRLAWHGKERQGNESNPGSFALVQLYHVSDAGTVEEPKTVQPFWEDPNWHKGPIFNRDGGTTRDWDPLFRIPVYVANLEEFDVPREDVFSGAFLRRVEEWFTSAGRRSAEARKAIARDMNVYAEDLGREMTDRLWHEGSKPSETGINDVTWEQSRDDVQKMYKKKDQREKALTDYYKVPGM